MKKLILIPITLTALTPMVSMVGCNKPTPEESTITINATRGWSAEGDEDKPGGLDGFVIGLNTGDKKTEITHDANVVFNSPLASYLSYNKPTGTIDGYENITPGEYDIPLVATYEGITSNEYIFHLKIIPKPSITISADEGWEAGEEAGYPGFRGSVSIGWSYKDQKIDISTEAQMIFHDSPIAGALSYNAPFREIDGASGLSAGDYYVPLYATYDGYSSQEYTFHLRLI